MNNNNEHEPIDEEMQGWHEENNHDPNNDPHQDEIVHPDDDDESDEDEPHDNDDDDDDDASDHNGPRRNVDGSVDGGVVFNLPKDNDDPSAKPKTRSGECELILAFECHESIDVAPNHAMLQPGVKVSIGLDKTTKLQAVFTRYVTFLAEQDETTPVTLLDVEFSHVQLLDGADTAETSALMKYDTILVRNVQKAHRDSVAEGKRLQREADRDFYKKMRLLLKDVFFCDVLLDCRGNLVDENGLNQKVLTTGVRAYSALVSKRCPWLGRRIQTAREELERHSVVTLPEHADDDDDDDDDDDGLIVGRPPIQEGAGALVAAAAVKIGSSEDDYDEPTRGADSSSSLSDTSRLLWVTLSNHPPDAVRLLLEYCYTNRVVELGQNAFLAACRTPGKDGPVPPFPNHSSRSRGWPDHGLPTISYSVALSAIRLAEEAQMPRFSLMCEVAAAELVRPSTVVDALTLCTTQQQTTGNPLPRLRKAAMDELLRHGQSGVERPTFCRALKEKGDAVVPSLLVGTMEAIQSESKKFKPPMFPYDDIDQADTLARRRERRKRRKERLQDGEDGTIIDDDDEEEEEKEMMLAIRGSLKSKSRRRTAPSISCRRSSKASRKRSRGSI